MTTQIFVNLPVRDLKKSMEFFSKLNFKFDPQFTNENAAAMIIEENIYVMLLMENFFKTFTSKEISDAHKTTEVLTGISAESREAVDKMVETAVLAGGKATIVQEYDWMYDRGFEDLDGHLWEVAYMDLNKLNQWLIFLR